MAGCSKPANVSVYTKLMAVPLTVGVQFGFGHSKLAKNSSELTAVAVCAGTISLPFLVEVTTDEVVVVSCSVNGSTRCPPGFVHVPVNVEVTAKFTVAFVLPTPWILVPVQETVSPLRVHTGAASPCAKCAPDGALAKLTVVTASAGTAAKAVTSSDSTAIMPNFLIKVFLLFLGRHLLFSKERGVFTPLPQGSRMPICGGWAYLCSSVNRPYKRPAPCRLMTSS